MDIWLDPVVTRMSWTSKGHPIEHVLCLLGMTGMVFDNRKCKLDHTDHIARWHRLHVIFYWSLFNLVLLYLFNVINNTIFMCICVCVCVQSAKLSWKKKGFSIVLWCCEISVILIFPFSLVFKQCLYENIYITFLYHIFDITIHFSKMSFFSFIEYFDMKVFLDINDGWLCKEPVPHNWI